ncbi:hypothetical protein L873DRAFT_1796092 [Choiromyces venosus 120613-1]|uniref:Uncharacterized protein n=1 Tax=Choiromyces venosus 120613-1 TaxID=1336337 RepID=A0A3N4IZ18_9PEZI|nr:hypothetical protein L873DRAFT_1796092 [Choiromyces venosus 120613-1]
MSDIRRRTLSFGRVVVISDDDEDDARDELPRGRTVKRALTKSTKGALASESVQLGTSVRFSATQGKEDDDNELAPTDEPGQQTKGRLRNESRQSWRYRMKATKAKLQPKKCPPPDVLCATINTEVTRLTRLLEEADKRDRSTLVTELWCRQRGFASAAVTTFIGKYWLDMELIYPKQRLEFATACVACLQPYKGNRPMYDTCDAMWRMIRALKLDLEMSKACGVDSVFPYWQDEKIYFKRVREVALDVEERLEEMRGLAYSDSDEESV